ncbi:hypothetical protein [Campylobacter molothri]|uniref:hypothetical protein n=1 Tax=Campylobacter molothri TaxID=1032242 RepID=UPI001DBB4DE5|nr:hypothetical protein [Campylobacter sp. W0067]MBZ7944027.1 hypothetical protein [Campylobacter sp. RM13744]MBZ7960203.1 hypothetical protein [Campylobacter sp. RM12397]MBZ7961474.1 hypothetical protein [Campylobacter sp. RM9930]MBZ7963056.1 hypothetical protein [Campylobacter sp. W0049]MBZ7969804.1 hypothetical protein [Campylobacter sp. RM3125]MBZ7971372.1 hypothetical protein [Campylobacter sp. RM3124]
MLEDDFLKEKQNIRQKMLNFSRAMNQGKPLDDELKNEIISSNDIFKRRLNKQPRNLFDPDEYEIKNSKKSNIYLKEDLINVKLEEKQSLAKKIFSKIKEKNKNSHTKKNKKKLFSLKKTEKEIEPKKIQENKIETKNLNKKNNKESQLPKKENNHKLDKKNSKIPQTDIKQSLENLQKKIHTNNITDIPLKKNSNEEDTEQAKNTLLEGFTDATKEDRNLNFNHLLFAILLVSFALLLFIPQIYIRNQIYYLSREIATLKTEESVLNEENKDLKRRLENMRFQNQILDYLD